MNLYGSEMRDIRNNRILIDKIRKAEDAIEDFVQLGIKHMETTHRFTPSEIGDVMIQWVNAVIKQSAYDMIPNDKYPQYREVDSAMDDFLVSGKYYDLYNTCGYIRVFGEKEHTLVRAIRTVSTNGLVEIHLDEPNITLFFMLRERYEEYHLKFQLQKIIQNLW